MKLFLIALQYVTTIPNIFYKEPTPKELAKSLKYIPFAGLAVGICLVVIQFILSFYFPSSISRLFLIAFLLIAAGTRYMENSAYVIDTAIANISKKNVPKNPVNSPVGIIVIFIIILAKYIALGEYVGRGLYGMLLFFPMMGRMGMLTAYWMFPDFIPENTGRFFIHIKGFMIAALSSLLIGFFCTGILILFIFGVILIAIILIGKYFVKIFPETEPQIMGFINEFSELVALLIGTVVL